MNEEAIRKLIKLVESSDIESLEVRKWFRTIRITKRQGSANGSSPAAHASEAPSAHGTATPGSSTPPSITSAPMSPPLTETPATPTNLLEIKSPMVGTFYRAPAPDAPPFIETGKVIKPGDILCIIEAMKLMNEIEAEQSGKIVKVLVENAQPVEFGQPLFLIDPSVL